MKTRMLDPMLLPAIPWLQSPVQRAFISALIGAVAVAFPKAWIFQLFHVTDQASADALTDKLIAGLVFLAALYGAKKRASSPIQPLTLTQADADVHPNTIASANPSVDLLPQGDHPP